MPPICMTEEGWRHGVKDRYYDLQYCDKKLDRQVLFEKKQYMWTIVHKVTTNVTESGEKLEKYTASGTVS